MFFFLTPAAFSEVESAGAAWVAYGSQQGFIGYDLSTGTAAEPFREYGRITDEFYQTLITTTGQSRRLVQPNPKLTATQARLLDPPVLSRGQAPTISALSPTTLPAGAGAVLTITGSGFGATRGAGFVEFRNADNGTANSFVKPQEEEYESWTDTRIQVRVPSVGEASSSTVGPAGSGPVRVTTSDQLTTTSTAVITIPYAISNVISSTNNQVLRPSPINQNGRGGYGFKLETGFAANAPAVAAFRRALSTWRCQSGMNWEAENTPRTGRGATLDGDNSIGFDQGAGLPMNVLGRTTSYYQGCFLPGGGVSFAVQEIDMEFDDAAAWQYGPLPAVGLQLDFETVAVHELGHAQQLSHVILPRAVMHFAIARGQTSRQISTDDITGGRLVLRTRGFVPQGCNPRPMLPAPLTAYAADPSTSGVVLTWTTQDECFLQNFVVERSVRADTTAWITLGTVSRAGTSYRYVDASTPGGLRYYRLRLRRPDNSLDTAAPLAVQSDPATAGQPLLFPNPTGATGVRLQFPASTTGRLVLSVFDALGRRHSFFALDYRPGLNLLPFPTAYLRPGWYVLRLRTPDGKEQTLPFVRIDD